MRRDWKNKNLHVICLISFMFMGLLFITEDMAKVQVPQRNKMLSLYCTAIGFISNNEENNRK